MRRADMDRLIERLGLQPLPGEGGLFASSYRSAQALPGGEGRPLGSAIYYLLLPGDFSALHRLDADEIYHFYLGSPVEMLLLEPDGGGRSVTLGPDVLGGQQVQAVVRAGVWQGARLRARGSFALLGATMAPAYLDEGFTLGQRAGLQAQYPRFAREIERLTREGAP